MYVGVWYELFGVFCISYCLDVERQLSKDAEIVCSKKTEKAERKK